MENAMIKRIAKFAGIVGLAASLSACNDADVASRNVDKLIGIDLGEIPAALASHGGKP